MRTTSLIAGLTMVTLVLSMSACGGGEAASDGPPGASGTPPATNADGAGKSNANLFTAADITLGDIDQAMVEKGRGTYDVKCQACHSTGVNRVVGPGWKGITERRKPEWIMNMILNIDAMLESDPEAQKALEECLVRMPNQGLSKDEGREVLEFMRTL
ncbi:MAG TPA: cytochrome c [Flavobacteriales bacterium]|nr:cytochrome c [Flavobacteriales bacterium]